MPLSVEDFWRLACKSGLISKEEARAWHPLFRKAAGASQGEVRALAKWLVARGTLTRYQASVLLAGKSGPLVCGDYRIEERVDAASLKGLFYAMHTPSGRRVLLRLVPTAIAAHAEWRALVERRRVLLEPMVEECWLRVDELGACGKLAYIAAAHLPGESLPGWLAGRGVLRPEEAWRIGSEVARALGRLHEKGESQGALTSEHVWVDDAAAGRVCVVGFPFCNDDAADGTSAADLMDLGKLLAVLVQATAAPQSAPAAVQRLMQDLAKAGSKQPTAAAVAETLAGLTAVSVDAEEAPLVRIADDARLDTVARLQTRRRTQRSRRAIMLALGGVVGVACVLGGIWWWQGSSGNDRDFVAAPRVAAPTAVGVVETNVDRPPLGSDDPDAFWQSPTEGDPIALRYLPLGAPFYMVWRAGDFLSHAEGAKVLDTLGPIGSAVRDEIGSLVGIPLEQVDRLTVGLYDAGPAAWQMSLVVELQDPPPLDALISMLGDPTAMEQGEGAAYRGATHVYYFPNSKPDLWAIVPQERLEEVVTAGDAPPLLRREFEQLLATTDADRQLTMLFAPSFFWHGGGQLVVAGPLQPIEQMLTRLVGDRARAVSAALHLDENVFVELRVVGPTDERVADAAERLEAAVAGLPDDMERRLQSASLSEYSRPVLERYPLMLRMWSEHTRVAAEGREVALRTYLPAVAAHNLALGLQLSLSAGNSVAEPEPAMVVGAEPTGGLQQVVSLSFPRNTLEKALEMLGEEIGLPIEIVGSDLQLEGITKNQSFGLDLRERPAVEILRSILLQASPDGKLVYTIRSPAGAGEPETIVVTTRAAAAKRGDKLPPEFAE